MKLKLIALITITTVSVLSMILLPMDSFFRETGVFVLESLTVIVAAWVGLGAVSFFGTKSVLGKSLLFLSLGMFFWGLGCFLNIFFLDYPSIGDIGYILTIPFSGYGLFLILKNIDFKYTPINIIKLVVLPLIILIPTYFFAINGNLGGDLSLSAKALNIIYPIGDVIFLSFALLILSMTYGGGIMFKPFAIISLGFGVEAIADYFYSYGMATDTYYNGNICDISFCIAFFIIGVGMYSLWKVNQSDLKSIPATT